MKKFRTYALNVGLVLAGLLVALALAEGFVRVFYPHSRDHVVPSGLFAFDNDLGWRMTGNGTFVHRSRYFEVAYRTNQSGYRDRPRQRETTPGKYRILLYGDSQIFGWGVEQSKRMSDLLEIDIENLEFLNLAVPGYGLDQQVLSYLLDGKSFEADEVLFYVSPNTLLRMRKNFMYSKYKPQFKILPGDKLEVVPIPKRNNAVLGVIYNTLSPFYLPYFVQRKLARIRSSADMPKQHSKRNEQSNSGIGQLDKLVLRKAKRRAGQRNQKLSIIANLNGESEAALKEFCRSEGISFYAIAPRRDTGRFGPHDPHWNVKGNMIFASEMMRMITVP